MTANGAAPSTAGSERRRHVFAKLDGQLGNQMLQYAAGRALAEHLTADLVLVTRQRDQEGQLTTHLAPFEIDGFELIGPELPRTWTGKKWRRIKERWLDRDDRRMGVPIVRDDRLRSIDDFFTITDDCYLAGYWQSPGFFEPIADRIRAEFDLRRFDQPQLRGTHSLIDPARTVAVHVRLGDFVGKAERSDWFDYCRRDYFDRARKLLDRSLPEKHYLVFSDDPSAARRMLEGWSDCTFVEGNSATEDMFLISRCRHIVIANSTFSWWAAWLGARPDSLVIAPRLWLGTLGRGPHPLPDPFPKDWIVI
ncbi:MAG: alpha-1,2-fucosyltransferase [Alphaproteobacteria bacterium]|nr:alpha-1,2-fucosyltransferase [Alphaproteobacteria bacterium]